jgi:Flp pilus assembly protein CpaB
LKRCTATRRAAINASTVFAVTLAIIAGLIFAWVFKTVFLTPKKAPVVPVEPTYRVTVMAISVSDNTRISPLQVKRINVSKAKYDEYKAEEKTKGTMLVGNQPVSRVTRDTLRAEEPIYEGQLKEMHYPKPVSEMLEPGKVASIVEVPSRNTMVHVDDRVDLLCTLTNHSPEVGPVETRTAVMAKNVRVVARFNTTRDAPTAPRGTTRPYTLEVTPYRYGLIELAKSLGGLFALRIHDRSESAPATVSAADTEDDPVVPYVTTDDLAKLFGFSAPLPTKYFEVESFSGVSQNPGRHIYQAPAPSGQPAPGGAKPTTPGGARPSTTPGSAPGAGLKSASALGGAASATALAASATTATTGWQRVSLDSGAGVSGRKGGLASRGGTNVAALQRGGGLGLNGIGTPRGGAMGLTGPAGGAGVGCGKPGG